MTRIPEANPKIVTRGTTFYRQEKNLFLPCVVDDGLDVVTLWTKGGKILSVGNLSFEVKLFIALITF